MASPSTFIMALLKGDSEQKTVLGAKKVKVFMHRLSQNYIRNIT